MERKDGGRRRTRRLAVAAPGWQAPPPLVFVRCERHHRGSSCCSVAVHGCRRAQDVPAPKRLVATGEEEVNLKDDGESLVGAVHRVVGHLHNGLLAFQQGSGLADVRVQVQGKVQAVARAARAAVDDRAVFAAPADSFLDSQLLAAGAGAIAREGAEKK